jgi:hypothetical protein
VVGHIKYLNFKWRASLVPAAAVIPAPLAYTIIVAVKRLVVGLNNNKQTSFVIILFESREIAEAPILEHPCVRATRADDLPQGPRVRATRAARRVSARVAATHAPHASACKAACFGCTIRILPVSFVFFFNTVNKSECTKHVFDYALNVLSWNVAFV